MIKNLLGKLRCNVLLKIYLKNSANFEITQIIGLAIP